MPFYGSGRSLFLHWNHKSRSLVLTFWDSPCNMSFVTQTCCRYWIYPEFLSLRMKETGMTRLSSAEVPVPTTRNRLPIFLICSTSERAKRGTDSFSMSIWMQKKKECLGTNFSDVAHRFLESMCHLSTTWTIMTMARLQESHLWILKSLPSLKRKWYKI